MQDVCVGVWGWDVHVGKLLDGDDSIVWYVWCRSIPRCGGDADGVQDVCVDVRGRDVHVGKLYDCDFAVVCQLWCRNVSRWLWDADGVQDVCVVVCCGPIFERKLYGDDDADVCWVCDELQRGTVREWSVQWDIQHVLLFLLDDVQCRVLSERDVQRGHGAPGVRGVRRAVDGTVPGRSWGWGDGVQDM